MSEEQRILPLLGDGRGGYRIQIVGGAGSGKTTLASHLSKILGVPHIPLDELFWEPGWNRAPAAVFKHKMKEAMRQGEESQPNGSAQYTGWISDGNYFSWGGAMITKKATDVIWLDPPFVLAFWRIFMRSIRRLLRVEKPCSTGCDESIGELFFSRSSILVFSVKQHYVMKDRYAKMMGTIGIRATNTSGIGSVPGSEACQHDGISARKMRRIGGWGKDLAAWVRDVEEMVELDRKKT